MKGIDTVIFVLAAGIRQRKELIIKKRDIHTAVGIAATFGRK